MAPVYLLPDAHRTPLVVAAEGSSVKLLSAEPGWYRVQFDDSRYERRVGYVEAKFVGSALPASNPASELRSTTPGQTSALSPSAERLSGAPAQQSRQVAGPIGNSRVPVTIIGRQDNTTGYTFSVPGYWQSTGIASVNCFGQTSGSMSGTAIGTPGLTTLYGSYSGNSSANCEQLSRASGTVLTAEGIFLPSQRRNTLTRASRWPRCRSELRQQDFLADEAELPRPAGERHPRRVLRQ